MQLLILISPKQKRLVVNATGNLNHELRQFFPHYYSSIYIFYSVQIISVTR
jgi:hypothetical protein